MGGEDREVLYEARGSLGIFVQVFFLMISQSLELLMSCHYQPTIGQN